MFLFHLHRSPGEEQLQCPVLELCNSSGEPTAPILWEPAPRGAAPFLHLSDAPGIHSKAPLLLCLGFVQRALPGTEQPMCQSLLLHTMREGCPCTPATMCPTLGRFSSVLFYPAVSPTSFNLLFCLLRKVPHHRLVFVERAPLLCTAQLSHLGLQHGESDTQSRRGT